MDFGHPLTSPGDHHRATRLLYSPQNSKAFCLKLRNHDGFRPIFHDLYIAFRTTMVNNYGQLMFVGAHSDLSCSTTPMMTRSLHVFLVSMALLLVAGCKSKGPTPKEGAGATPQVGTTESGGAHPGRTQDPHAGMAPTQDPHAGMAPPSSPPGGGQGHGQPDASGMIDVGAVSFKVPAKWAAQPPKSSMRRAQLSAPGSAGPAELIVFFFGPQGAGSAQENLDRWIGQFSNPDGSPVSDAKKTSSKVAGGDVTKLEVAGQFAGGMAAAGQPQAAQANQRLLAAIVNTQGGPYYFKFLGPSATVTENSAAFDEVIASIVASP